MILHRDGPDRRNALAPRPGSVTELGRVLREARVACGLELFQVSQQTDIPVDQLGDLESGTVDRLPDRVESLKALERYATFLGLPGDQFVMTLLEHWPAPSSTAPLPVPSHGAPSTGVDLLEPAPTARHRATAQVPAMLADTGPNAVRRGHDDGPGIKLLRTLVVMVLFLVLLGTAWLAVNRVRPQWLADLHLPNTANSSGPTTAGGTARSSTGSPTAPAPDTASLRLVSANGAQASFAVTSSQFDVQISASGGETWVQASAPGNTPAYAGLLTDGQSQVVAANHQLVVQTGSIAARIAVRVDQRVIGTYVPPGAPFQMTFTTQ